MERVPDPTPAPGGAQPRACGRLGVGARRRASRALALTLLVTAGCSVERYAVDRLGDALAGTNGAFAAEDDVELAREAAPFGLKLVESVLAETPEHPELLLAATRGFVQYAYAFLQQDADRLEEHDLAAAEALRARARDLFLRARDYGLRGLAVVRPAAARDLAADPRRALAAARRGDVPYLYWTAAAWGSALSLSKDRPDLLADQPVVEALIDRALELDPDHEQGSIHTFLIAYEPARVSALRGWEARSKQHFEAALRAGGGRLAAPWVAYAETVLVREQDRAGFERALGEALAVDPAAAPASRLENRVIQARARWLLSKVDELFVE